MEARLHSPTDIAGFRLEALELLAHQVPPEDVTWSAPDEADTTFTPPDVVLVRNRQARAASSIVPASFVRLCDYVVQHRDPGRFALLYRLLWRLVHEPHLRHDAADPDMVTAQHMAHAVRRDIHKLKVTTRLRPINDPSDSDNPLHVVWCEPAHYVVEAAAPALCISNASIRWALLTPDRSLYWDRWQLRLGAGSDPSLSAAAPDDVWLNRWRTLFP